MKTEEQYYATADFQIEVESTDGRVNIPHEFSCGWGEAIGKFNKEVEHNIGWGGFVARVTLIVKHRSVDEEGKYWWAHERVAEVKQNLALFRMGAIRTQVLA